MRPTPTNPSTGCVIKPCGPAKAGHYVRLSLNEWIRHALSGGNPHALHLQVLLDHLLPALAAETGPLVAAERRQIAHRAIGVDPHRSGLELVGHLERPTH